MTSTRMRFVSLRMSQDEYDRLKVLGKTCGSPSLSSFIRSCVSWILSNGQRTLLEFLATGENVRGWDRPANTTIAELGRRIREFDRELEQLELIRDRLSIESTTPDGQSKTKENDRD